ncbi:HAD-IA family hydrolase [Haloimpatiens massiliensis]|uniref:HAD-IA family hydrolase n=1 Tax=Haloimpatiens massiliensis TaxID=1658110 RepID=UPI000C82A152|nr:HAD-IA family hydrolase [Haloimpatiens massiliensis]
MVGIHKKDFDKNKIKAILLDSGKVLNTPVTGHWFITPNFFTYVDKKTFTSIKPTQKKLAFDKAMEYISKQNLIIDEEEEYKYFIEYYKILSKYLPELQLKNEDVQAITKDYVYNYTKYIFFSDAINLIPELSKFYKLAVVSDAWPSLENVFRQAGLRDYFSSFIISSQKGVTKPHELMYKTALEDLNVSPNEAIFIDDNIKNCHGAIKLGITSFVLCRGLKSYAYHKLKHRNYNIIKNLIDIKNILN